MGSNESPQSSSLSSAGWGRSELVKELAKLPEGQRSILELHDWILTLLDAAITAAMVSVDPHDLRSAEERLDWLIETFDLPESGDEIERFTARLTELSEMQVPRWAKKTGTDSWKRFLRRFIGAAAYDRLAAALVSDTTVLAHALRQLISKIQPYALAVDDCAILLTPEQVAKLGPFGTGPTNSVLHLVLTLDGVLTKVLEANFDFSSIAFDPNLPGESDLGEIIENLRPLLSGATRKMLAEISAKLSRKLAGASTALNTSEDGVAQAAGSLVELIDRLFREAFPDEQVLAWLEATDRGAGSEFVYIDKSKGISRPTKRAQALCFVHGGQVAERSIFHEVAAAGLVVAREKLQKIKHADTGDPEEREIVERALTVVESFLSVAIEIGWLGLPSETVDGLKLRLAA